MSSQNKLAQHPGAALFAVAFLLAALVLLAYIGTEAKFSARGKWTAQPAFWPAIGLGGMCLFGTAFAWQCLRNRASGTGPEVILWLRSVEFLGWFMAYVFAVPLIGYLPATLLMATSLAYRVGYRGRDLIWAGAMGLAIVLIFKTALAVKIPGGAIYEYLPDALRTFAIVNF